MEYDAILKDYIIVHYEERNPPFKIIYGTIYGDKKGRFADGSEIRTSRVETLSEKAEDGSFIAKTLNTTYRLENPVRG